MNRLTSLPDNWLHWLQENRKRWLRTLVVATVLLVSLGLPFLDTDRFRFFGLSVVQLTLIFILGTGGVLILLRHRQLGLVALVIGGMLVPFEIGTGSGSSINLSLLLVLLLLGLWVLDLLAGDRKPSSLSREELPLLLFVGAVLVAFLVGQIPWFPLAEQQAPLTAQIGQFAIFALSAGAFLLVAHEVRELYWLKWLTWTFVVLGSVFVFARLWPAIGWRITELYQPGTYDNSMFWTWLVAIALGQALFNRRLSPLARTTLVGVVAATLYVAYVVDFSWKSGWLPCLVAIAVIVSLRSWRIGVVLGLVGLIAIPGLFSELIASDEYSYSTRLDAWLLMLEMIKRNPIVGFGPANYYWYTPLFPIRGYSVVFNSHNQYVDIIAQTGLLGLGLLLWFFASVGKLGWRLRDEAPQGFARGYVYGALGGLAGTLVAGFLVDWFFPFVYNIGLKGFRASVLPWLFLGGLVSISYMVQEREQDLPLQ